MSLNINNLMVKTIQLENHFFEKSLLESFWSKILARIRSGFAIEATLSKMFLLEIAHFRQSKIVLI